MRHWLAQFCLWRAERLQRAADGWRAASWFYADMPPSAPFHRQFDFSDRPFGMPPDVPKE